MATLQWSDDDERTVDRQSYRAQASQIIRSQIVSGRLEPGSLYSIGAIAERLNVSITPVREALHDLAKDGLIEMRRNRGFVVRCPNEEELDDIVQIRTMLEVGAVTEITERSLITDFDHLRTLCERNRAYAWAQDWENFVETDRQFHLGILRFLENPRLVEIVGNLRDQSRLWGLDRIAGSESFQRSLREHDALLDAIEAGEAAAAASVMRTHLTHVRGLWAGLNESDSHVDDA
ncbi:GntR family transcriptional regulator [Saccharopolyspora phatthalungensis]|uniref:DNA-binding GntR family transcriptional regulator n=1 Tax=Saccharopolyspora phatthalungensis TaxID=664693 RepID=A0A840QG42_9PSEU|nr:GntR family transcriptional regulator [Saccharopolyspora phatthalungensis]MBB5159814.1 DNA-binding GntR family transcriptional regulator [Saccharopolyspora phatthalungensis]